MMPGEVPELAKGPTREPARWWISRRVWAGAIVSLLIVVFMWHRIRYRQIILEPISVPDDLAKVGYTPTVVARRLADSVGQVYRQAKSVRDTPELLTDSSIEDIQVPGAHVNLRTCLDVILMFFQMPTLHISGDISEGAGSRFLLHLRFAKSGEREEASETSDATDVESLFPQGAALIVTEIDPYQLAASSLSTSAPKSVTAIYKLLAANPRDPWAMTLWGTWLLNRNLFPEAIAQYRKVLSVEPSFAVAEGNLGVALVGIGRPGEASVYFRAALAHRHPRPNNVYRYWGDALIRADSPPGSHPGKLHDAIDLYQSALRIDHLDREAYVGLGTARSHLKQYESALSEYRLALGVDPECASCYLFAGEMLNDLGDAVGADSYYGQALLCDPQLTAAFRARGDLRFTLRDYGGAVAQYDAALRTIPTTEASRKAERKDILLWKAKAAKAAVALLHNV